MDEVGRAAWAIFWRGNLGVHSAVGEGAGVEDKEVLGGV